MYQKAEMRGRPWAVGDEDAGRVGTTTVFCSYTWILCIHSDPKPAEQSFEGVILSTLPSGRPHISPPKRNDRNFFDVDIAFSGTTNPDQARSIVAALVRAKNDDRLKWKGDSGR